MPHADGSADRERWRVVGAYDGEDFVASSGEGERGSAGVAGIPLAQGVGRRCQPTSCSPPPTCQRQQDHGAATTLVCLTRRPSGHHRPDHWRGHGPSARPRRRPRQTPYSLSAGPVVHPASVVVCPRTHAQSLALEAMLGVNRQGKTAPTTRTIRCQFVANEIQVIEPDAPLSLARAAPSGRAPYSGSASSNPDQQIVDEGLNALFDQLITTSRPQ